MAQLQLNNRRERRIAARKAQILDAAAQVFSRQGYERATTREIADIADVSEGTLYNYFNSKRDLLIGVAKAYADQVAKEISRVDAEDFGEMLASLMANRFRTGRERRLFMLFLYESRNNEDVHQYYVQNAMHRIIDETEKRIKVLIAEGRMRSIDPVVAARMLSATIMGFAALFELGASVDHTSPEKLGEQVTDIFLNGLSVQEKARE
ncbi:MAG: TetR/AcrR family transcriptional regulator [Chloroflexi bacterium]|nr:MAG: TetR/AcrR family transcriptional regulator [Chloroflexota bacterium]